MTPAPAPATRPRALIVSARDLHDELEATVLWRDGVERRHVDGTDAAFEEAKRFSPNLVIVEATAEQPARALIAALRECAATKGTAIVVLSRDLLADAERALVLAGANLTVPLPLNVELWGGRLEQLLLAPPRLETRTPVRAALWSQAAEEPVEFPGTCLNISRAGMRIEAGRFLLGGAKLDVHFRLPGQAEDLGIVAQVVWSARGQRGLYQSGLEFLVLRGNAAARIGEYLEAAFSNRAGGGLAAVPAAAEPLDEGQVWERELRLSEGRKMAIIDTATDAIVTVDSQGEILEFNTASELLLGHKRSQVLGKNALDLFVPPRLHGALHEQYRRLVSDRHRLFGTLQFESTALRCVGEEFPVAIVLRPMMVKGHLLFTAFMHDLSPLRQAEAERRTLEERLRQAHKLEAIGTLASGIAHEFNNALCTIFGYGEMTLSELPTDSIAHSNLRQILAAADRAKHIVRQILAFSRRDAVERKHLRVDAVVLEALHLVEQTFPAAIEVRKKIRTDVGSVLADETQLQQIVINLCANAMHAMREGGGTLSIFLEKVIIDEELSTPHLGPSSGAYALLVVKDTGHGMDQALLSRIFEPFFTTKGSGEGTGLGLAVVHGIVQRLGGAILAESACGKGSTFRVYLPLSDGEEKRAPLAPGQPRAGSGRILFVDDEATIAEIARKVLGSLGYATTVLTSSAAALALLRNDPAAFDLLITDQDMPEVSGMELIAAARSLRPDFPVILCTGLAEYGDRVRAAEMHVDAIVLKPFRQADLVESIETVLRPRP
jgi:PAS domain S-box-containing protein